MLFLVGWFPAAMLVTMVAGAAGVIPSESRDLGWIAIVWFGIVLGGNFLTPVWELMGVFQQAYLAIAGNLHMDVRAFQALSTLTAIAAVLGIDAVDWYFRRRPRATQRSR
jgi:hypothetical protein